MKIEGRNTAGKAVDLQKVRESRAKETRAAKESESTDKVDARLSKTLKSITKAISESGLTAGEIHSNVDEKRLERLMESFDRVDAKQPRLSDEEILNVASRLADKMQDSPKETVEAFHTPDKNRVADLISGQPS